MARAKAKAAFTGQEGGASRSAARARRAAKPRARRRQPKPRRPHKFVKSHLRAEDFKADGLRTYAHYRDLGVKDATHGMALAHVIRFVGQCDPKVVSKNHLHEADFQMIYVLKGTHHHGDRGPRRAHHECRATAGCSRTAPCTRCSTIPTAARCWRS